MSNSVHDRQLSTQGLPEARNRLISRPARSIKHRLTSDVLILDAGLRQSLTMMRSLGKRGLRITALETYSGAPAFSSRWCQQRIVCPTYEDIEEYITFLEQVLDATKARVLIASSDGTIAAIRRYREQIERRGCVALAKEPALGNAINKEQTLAIARKVGLNTPRGLILERVSEVKTALNEIGLPAVVKPSESWIWDKQGGTRFESRLVTTSEEALRAVEELTGAGKPVLFQQFLPGSRESVSFMYAEGQIFARFAHAIKRTNPPLGGTDVVRQSIAVPSDIGEQAERLVREIELEGYCLVEFRRDNEGKPYLMEINSRLSAGVELAVRAGVDFPYLLYQWANGERIDIVKEYRTGYWMRDLGGDSASTVASLLQRGRPGIVPPARLLGDFCASFFVPMRFDCFDWDDLHPTGLATAGWFVNTTERATTMLAEIKAPGLWRSVAKKDRRGLFRRGESC